MKYETNALHNNMTETLEMAFLDPNRLLLAGGIGHDLAENLYDQAITSNYLTITGTAIQSGLLGTRDSQIHHNYL